MSVGLDVRGKLGEAPIKRRLAIVPNEPKPIQRSDTLGAECAGLAVGATVVVPGAQLETTGSRVLPRHSGISVRSDVRGKLYEAAVEGVLQGIPDESERIKSRETLRAERACPAFGATMLAPGSKVEVARP